jgi:hypothetical protein
LVPPEHAANLFFGKTGSLHNFFRINSWGFFRASKNGSKMEAEKTPNYPKLIPDHVIAVVMQLS